MGPTGSGKSEFAEALAGLLGAQLVSADAFQAYRGFDIGTAKPRDRAKYQLLDFLDPDVPYGAGAFVRLAGEALARCFEQQAPVVVVGGTGLYVRALFEGYRGMHGPPDPALRERLAQEEEARPGSSAERLRRLVPDAQVDWANPARVRRALERALAPRPAPTPPLPPFRILKLALVPERRALWESIAARTARMFDEGWADEVRALLGSGVDESAPAFRAIGYQSVARAVRGQITDGMAQEEVTVATRQYAKRQYTWLRSEPNLRRLELGGPVMGTMALGLASDVASGLRQSGGGR
jgi:tRNA dimethylallyltransferase